MAFGQVEEFQQRARINWLLDLNRDSREILPNLIENLGVEAGLRGSKFLSASANPGSPMFETLRRTGYCSYGWERFWQLKPDYTMETLPSGDLLHWSETTSFDIHDLKQFQHKHLSPAVRAVTPLANESLPEYVLKKEGRIYAYARVKKIGSKGLIQPIIASELEDWNKAILSLLLLLKDTSPIWYLQQSTSQNRLDDFFEKTALPITDKIELMVKHFTIMEKSQVRLLNHSADNGHPDPVAPFMNTSKTQDNL